MINDKMIERSQMRKKKWIKEEKIIPSLEIVSKIA